MNGIKARIQWAGHPLHGKVCTVLREVEVEGLTRIGRLFACRVHSFDTLPIVMRESELIPIAEPETAPPQGEKLNFF